MGRPPTSGYCHTCRKRRIKCDRTRPSCLRCLKSGYACKGYDLGLRMQSLVVVTEPEGSQRLARIVAPPAAPASSLITTGPSPPPLHQLRRGLARALDRRGAGAEDDDDGGSGGGYRILGGTAHEHEQQQQQARRRLDMPPEMNLTAFQEHMAFSYFFATYGWAYFWKPFLSLARETDLAPTASRMCSLALAYGHMGTGHSDKSLKSMGLELYGKSLREVQSLLTRGPGAKTELAQLCVPIVILGMYSFAIDRDLRLIHNIGVAQILKHCGPEAFQEDPLLTAFRSCRALLICQSFAIRRRTFLEDKKWKNVPWEKLPKTALDSLIDIMADMPGLVNDMAASEQPISPTTKTSFHEKVGELREQLGTWRWKWDRAYPGVAREVPSNLKLDSIETPVFREQLATMIKFDTTQQALEMLTYNAALLYLLQLEDLLEMGEPHNPSRLSDDDMDYIRYVAARHPSTPLLLPDEARFICQPALEAFRLIPSLYKNLVTTKDRIMVILAPLGIVYTSTRNTPELNSCMQSILEDIPFFGGGPPRELEVYELALGEAWKSKVPEPIPAGTSPTVSESTVELAISP
ncbi:hpp family protein [Diaporthe eres]|uniref:Zn(2)-C6 fungal-type domain-containing protein n=1 Tax=Diaporthe vaccinii TaxID=105482 RepID=A0ABR4E129_9PEZI|nr:hpp family protein [Diaporthe eres]